MTGYDLAYLVFLAASSPYFAFKLLTSGKWRHAFLRRLGLEKLPRRRGPCIWIHGVSLGEVLSARTLVERLGEAFPDHEVIISATTRTGYRVAKKTYAGRRVFYYPLDFAFVVRRFFSRLDPSAVILMELELWPNFLREAERRGIPVMVANGRISERSFPRYHRFRFFLAHMFRKVSRYAVQTSVYARRLTEMGVDPARVRVTGSLKYDTVDTRTTRQQREGARRLLGVGDDEFVLLGGSTHDPEERILFSAHRALQQRTGKTVRLALAPRHPERTADVARVAREMGIPTVRLSENIHPAPPGAAVLVDAIGILGSLYHGADLVFVGGSLMQRGGQNMLEPAGIGKPVLFGPHVFNFRETTRKLLDEDGALQVSSEEDLTDALVSLVRDPESARRLGGRAQHVILEEQGATARNVALLREVLEEYRGTG